MEHLNPLLRRVRARGFSIIEMIVVFLVIGMMMAAGAIQTGATSTRFKQQAEAERLISCLRWLREMARNQGRFQNRGYGVFFWYNQRAGCCFEYSPYSAWLRTVPDHPNNALTPFAAMGLPNYPLSLGNRTSYEAQTMWGEELSSGFSIYFQTDVENQPSRYPDSMRNQPLPPLGGNSYREYRVMFWPAGTGRPAGYRSDWSPYNSVRRLVENMDTNERGVTLPEFPGVAGTSGAVYYNRIYISSLADNPNGSPPVLPARIRIDPGTGQVRLMNQFERRANGTW